MFAVLITFSAQIHKAIKSRVVLMESGIFYTSWSKRIKFLSPIVILVMLHLPTLASNIPSDSTGNYILSTDLEKPRTHIDMDFPSKANKA